MSIFWVLLFLCGCKQEKKITINETTEPESFSFQNYGKLVELDAQVIPIVEGWSEFMIMEDSFSVLKRATNSEDLKLAIDDLIEKEKTLARGDYPEVFDKFQIKARQQVFSTFLYKMQGELLDNRKIDQAMKELIVAYNAYKQQFNIIYRNNLDAKLILDEK